MRIEGLLEGQPVRPLQPLEATGAPGPFVVTDSLGREVHRGSGSFLAAGASGWQTVRCLTTGQQTRFRLEPRTELRDGSGRMADLLAMLHHTMAADGEQGAILWNGRVYQFFVRWLRDHVHTLKGMRYFADELKTAIDLYRDSQREDGMVWDNVYPRHEHENYWVVRFTEGGFYRAFEDKTGEFKRIPVENDVEYLFVEGIYNTWKATGDDAWMRSCLDAAIRALEYTRTDTAYRWSERLDLPKRGYTIDTWDFQAEPDCNVEGDPMRIRPGTTRFGVMFGDATGYAMACSMLAEMLERAGRTDEAQRHRLLGESVLRRLNEVAWLGTHFRHHVPEDPSVVRDLGVDESSQVSLSNAYSLNRGIGRDQSRAILATYRRMRESLPEGSPGEWYTIWPPFERGFGGHCGKGQYMNGSVTPIVAGELARGAFEHGEEAYGADILERLADLGRRFGGRFHCSYTGWFPPKENPGWSAVDLAPYANADVHGRDHPDVPRWPTAPNDLRELPVGDLRLLDVPFSVPNPDETAGRGAVAVSEGPGFPQAVRVPIGRKASTLVLLHTVCSGGAAAGELRLVYSDGAVHRRQIQHGRDIVTWWMPDPVSQHGPRTLEIAWRGANPVLPHVAVCAAAIDNPHPDKVIEAVELAAAPEGAVWYVLGLTLAARPFRFPPSPISFGIPDNWGAAAVVYALLEGLAGVVCDDPAFRTSTVSPRWQAKGEARAQVCVAFPASGGYVAYDYTADPEAKAVRVTIASSGDACRLRVLVPRPPTGVLVDGQPVGFRTESVGDSSYAVPEAPVGCGPHRVEVFWG